MTRSTTVPVVLLAWLMIGGVAAVATAADDPDFAAPTTAAADSAAAKTRDFTYHFQVGTLLRVAGEQRSHAHDDEPTLVLNVDVTGLVGDPRRPAWGVGAHLSADSQVRRAGLKVPWRFPLDDGGRGYVQVSPGIYLLGHSDAAIFGLPDGFGVIEPGSPADLVLWSGDPLEVTTWAEQVIVGGKPVDMVSRQTLLRDRYLESGTEMPRAYVKP